MKTLEFFAGVFVLVILGVVAFALAIGVVVITKSYMDEQKVHVTNCKAAGGISVMLIDSGKTVCAKLYIAQ